MPDLNNLLLHLALIICKMCVFPDDPKQHVLSIVAWLVVLKPAGCSLHDMHLATEVLLDSPWRDLA